uniref:CCHC-type domain-containing protein n=1 Tax=Salarias fasciatus TaxID=181472 RepID=A0A672H822_SALFA
MSSADRKPSPDDVPPIQQAIVNQEARLEQHEKLLQNLIESNRAIFDQVSKLTSQVTSLSPQQPGAAPIPDQAPPSGHVNVPLAMAMREPSAPAPERYDGEPGSCQAFLTQVGLVFELQPLSYPTDRARICYLIGLLKGSARAWGTTVWENQSPVCQTYQAFTLEMKKIFDHPVRGREAGDRLTIIRQGSRSVAEFAIEFRILAAECGWNDQALQRVFYRRLQDSLKDELARRDPSPDLDHLISLAIQIDNRIRERQREHFLQPHPPVSTQSEPVNLQSSLSDPEPMQIGRARLTPEERGRRHAANVCLYCGHAGHYIAGCPARPAKGRAPQ